LWRGGWVMGWCSGGGGDEIMWGEGGGEVCCA
jgi:hypothetical protein